jgi:hypothetical protein
MAEPGVASGPAQPNQPRQKQREIGAVPSSAVLHSLLLRQPIHTAYAALCTKPWHFTAACMRLKV